MNMHGVTNGHRVRKALRFVVPILLVAASLTVLAGAIPADAVAAPTWSTANPPARSDAAMAYDSATGQTVLFGGLDTNSNTLGDTWTYDGSTWHESATTNPPARSYAGMAYDGAIGKIVLFGGLDANSNTLGDTWTYDGTTWALQAPPISPPARSDASMVYAPIKSGGGQVALFGGLDAASNTLADTWTYNGSTWSERHPTIRPPSPRLLPPVWWWGVPAMHRRPPPPRAWP